MGHTHHHASAAVSRKLMISTGATALFVAFEFAAGLHANSLALIGDAFHNLTDALALLLALIVVFIERRPATVEKSFGYQRAGVVAAFVNAGTLLGFTFLIFWEAGKRIRNPEPVASTWMIGAALAALVLNSAITLWLREEGKIDVNIRSAVIHMLGDAVSSAGIVVAAFLIRSTGLTIFDPLSSIAIGCLIVWSSWGILKETVNLLLEGTPAGIDPEEVARTLGEEEGVHEVHHLHIWAIAPTRSALSCHIRVMQPALAAENDVLLARVTSMLAKRFGIEHTTIQLEHEECPEESAFCVLPDRHEESVTR